MQLIIEARVEGIDGVTDRDGVVSLTVIERHDLNVSDLGLTLSDGRALLAKLQAILVSQQVASWMSGETACRRCGLALAHKDSRSIMLRTAFGNVPLSSPWFWSCRRGVVAGAARRSVSPLCKALPTRVTPELQYLQAKWAAYLPYRQATNLLTEVLPLETAISASDTRSKLGKHLDVEVERDIANLKLQLIDPAWLRYRSSPAGRRAVRKRAELYSPWSQPSTSQRHVNIVAGQASFAGRPPRVYVYVHKEVESASARLDQFLARSGVGPNERVTVICDDEGEFGKAVTGSVLARGRILDWFHLAMKFRAAETSVFGSKMIEPTERAAVEREIRGAKWLVWHGKHASARARIRALDEELLAKPQYEFSALWWNLHRLSGYVRNSAGQLVNYGARHRKGLPISSSVAESAVNLVVSHRMAKQQQTRWTDEGAHRLGQVRVAALNGELSPARVAALIRKSPSRSRLAERAM